MRDRLFHIKETHGFTSFRQPTLRYTNKNSEYRKEWKAKMSIKYIVSILMLLLSYTTHAAEFTWFNNIEGKEGWIEFSAKTANYQNRIHIFPSLIGPDGSNINAKVDPIQSGVLVSFVIDSTSPGYATPFIEKVINSVAGLPSNVTKKYQLNVPNARAATVKILYQGEEVGRKEYSGVLPSTTTGQIRVETTSTKMKNDMLRGHFLMEAELELPKADFSSISISVSESLIAKYKVEALKSIVSRQRVSGGKFLFFDWRRKTSRTIVNQSINEQRSSSATRQTSVITVDADDDMLNRVEELLGFSTLTKEQFVQNHLSAASKAEAAASAASKAEAAAHFELAALHSEYAGKVDDPTPKVQSDLLEKAISALGANTPNLAAFIANGIQFSESSSSSGSRYHGLGRATFAVDTNSGYTELKLTTKNVRFVVSKGPFSPSEESIRSFFGTTQPNADASTDGLYRAIQQENIHFVRYALFSNARVNAQLGIERLTPLMEAAKKCNKTIVETLILQGANPFLRDSSNRSADQYASLFGCSEISMLIKEVE